MSTTRNDAWDLTPPEIERASELAVLAVLDRVLDIAGSAVIASHLELFACERPHWRPEMPDTKVARRLLHQCHALRRTLRHYRNETLSCSPDSPSFQQPPPSGGDDIDF